MLNSFHYCTEFLATKPREKVKLEDHSMSLNFKFKEEEKRMRKKRRRRKEGVCVWGGGCAREHPENAHSSPHAMLGKLSVQEIKDSVKGSLGFQVS